MIVSTPPSQPGSPPRGAQAAMVVMEGIWKHEISVRHTDLVYYRTPYSISDPVLRIGRISPLFVSPYPRCAHCTSHTTTHTLAVHHILPLTHASHICAATLTTASVSLEHVYVVSQVSIRLRKFVALGGTHQRETAATRPAMDVDTNTQT